MESAGIDASQYSSGTNFNAEQEKENQSPKRHYSLAPSQQKNYDHNQEQTKTGATLRMLGQPGKSGSDVKRRKKNGVEVGKEIGGTVYVHRDYVDDVVPEDVYENARQVLAEEYPDFTYNCVEYNPKTDAVRFDAAAGELRDDNGNLIKPATIRRGDLRGKVLYRMGIPYQPRAQRRQGDPSVLGYAPR